MQNQTIIELKSNSRKYKWVLISLTVTFLVICALSTKFPILIDNDITNWVSFLIKIGIFLPVGYYVIMYFRNRQLDYYNKTQTIVNKITNDEKIKEFQKMTPILIFHLEFVKSLLLCDSLKQLKDIPNHKNTSKKQLKFTINLFEWIILKQELTQQIEKLQPFPKTQCLRELLLELTTEINKNFKNQITPIPFDNETIVLLSKLWNQTITELEKINHEWINELNKLFEDLFSANITK